MSVIKVKLIDKISTIKPKILKSIAKDANARFRKAGGGAKLKRHIQSFLRQSLYNSPTVIDMLTPGSEIQRDLGLTGIGGVQNTSPSDRIDRIVSTLVDGVNVGLLPFTATPYNIRGSINIWGIPYDHSDVLQLSEAIQENTYSKKGVIPDFPFLEWLLTYGSQIVISTHYVLTGPNVRPEKSRTGYAVMVPGGSYSIPPEHQGEFGNNFITRAVDQIMEDDVPKLLQRIF
jgi:hypothetical protein